MEEERFSIPCRDWICRVLRINLLRQSIKRQPKVGQKNVGFLYLQAQNDEELTEAMKTFTQPEAMEQPVLLEVFTNKNKDARMLKNYYHQLKQK